MTSENIQCSRYTLSCTLCENLFQDPRFLPCGHTFCPACLKSKYKDAEKIKCYDCTELCQLPCDGIEKLPKNHRVDGATTFLDGDDDSAHQRSWYAKGNAILAICLNCIRFR